MCKAKLWNEVIDSRNCYRRGQGRSMKKLNGMVELENFNLFSFVCRIHSLAAKVVCCSHCLPMVNRKGEAILVRGCYLTVSHLRSAYKTALNSCNGLLEELLLGFDQPLRLEEVYDNFADLSPGFRFMPNQDPSKIEAICSALLKHVLHTQSANEVCFTSRTWIHPLKFLRDQVCGQV